jgi:hypothetical protein
VCAANVASKLRKLRETGAETAYNLVILHLYGRIWGCRKRECVDWKGCPELRGLISVRRARVTVEPRLTPGPERLPSCRRPADGLSLSHGPEAQPGTGPLTGPAPAGRCHLVVTPDLLNRIRQHLSLILDRESGGIAVWRRRLLWEC